MFQGSSEKFQINQKLIYFTNHFYHRLIQNLGVTNAFRIEGGNIDDIEYFIVKEKIQKRLIVK